MHLTGTVTKCVSLMPRCTYYCHIVARDGIDPCKNSCIGTLTMQCNLQMQSSWMYHM